MPATPKPLRVRALRLPAKKRLGLAALLLESINDEPELDRALLSELQQRAADLRSGKVKGLSTEKQRMAFRYKLTHHPAAAADFQYSKAYYAGIDQDLAGLFQTDFRAALRGIATGRLSSHL